MKIAVSPALAALLTLAVCSGLAHADYGTAQGEVTRLLAGANVQTQGLTLELPDWQEDGAFVPLTLHLQGAQPPVQLSLLRSGEDEPRIARLQLMAWREPLELSTRVRLPQSQQLIAVARDGRGRVWLAANSVAVLGSSCLSTPMGDPLAGLGQIKAWADGDAALELRSLLRHPMETGRRKNAQGQWLPRRLLRSFEVAAGQGDLLRVEPFEGLAANPYWRLMLPLGTGPLELRWRDADGQSYQTSLSQPAAASPAY